MSRGRRAAACTVVWALLVFLSCPVPSRAAPSPPGCPGSQASCTQAVIAMLNHERSLHGLSQLRLAVRQSRGITPCVGSIGHSRAMAGTRSIWHMHAGYPLASFPRNICVPYVVAGENVGEATSGNELRDLQLLLQAMMDEPHSPRFCLSSDNHACNILRSTYHRVGIGLYYVNGTTWLTEDFTG